MNEKPELTNLSTRTNNRNSEDFCDFGLCKVIENLSKSINTEFNKGLYDNLFIMPELDNLSILEKSQLARDLSELLHNYRTMRESLNFRESLESLRNFKDLKNQNEDILEEIFKGKEVLIDKNHSEEIMKLLFLTCNESESWKYREDLTNAQDSYIFLSQQVKKLVKNKILKKEQINDIRIQKEILGKEIDMFRDKEVALEKNLEDVMIDQFILEEQTNQLIMELNEAKSMLQEVSKVTHIKRRVKSFS